MKPLQGIRDEDYVIRCCNVQGTSSRQWTFDPKPFLEKEYDIFIPQRIEWIPMEELMKIYPRIKARAKVIYVIHETKLPETPIFWNFEWDAVVSFDERYKRMWKQVYPEEKIHIIPYPCNSLRKSDRNKSRTELNLPLDKKIVFTCSWYPSTHILPLIPPLAELNKKYPFIFLIVVAREYLDDEMLQEIKRYDFIEWRDDMPPPSKMDKYFYASDTYIFYKPRDEFNPGQIMVSSCILSYLGTLTPVLAIESPHIQPLGGAVIKFCNMEELKDKLVSVFEGRPLVNQTLKAAEEYVIRNSKEKVAEEYIHLFKQLIRGRN